MNGDNRRRILRGEGSRARRDRRLRRVDGNGTNLHDLPPELLQSIMLNVSQNLNDLRQARSASNPLARVIDDGTFLRHVDLFTMQRGGVDLIRANDFRMLCREHGNVSALFMHGASEFFHGHELDNGLAMIRDSAIRGYELGIYAYTMLRLIMSPTLQVDLDIPYPNRDLVRRMRAIVDSLAFRYWGPNRSPQLFLDRRASLDTDFIYRCRCAESNAWIRPWEEECKDPSMCDLCFYTIHACWFSREFPQRIRVWPMH